MTEVPHDTPGLPAALQQLAAVGQSEAPSPSDDTLALLLHFAAGDLERAIPTSDVDWDEIFREICRNGLVGLAQRYLARNPVEGRADAPPESFRNMIAQAHNLTILRLTTHYRAVGVTLGGLIRVGIEPIVLKGPALAQLIYPDPLLRAFGDLDLLIRERDVAATHRALLAQGFAATRDPSALPPRLVPQLTAYELQYWHPERHLVVEVHIDDPFSTGLAARDLDGYWRRSVPVSIGEVTVKTLSPDDQLLQLCAHAHYHSFTRLNWLSDLAFLLRDHGEVLDWRRIVATTRGEALQVPVYYSLRLLGLTLGIHAPAEVLAALRPDRFRRWWHERYLPESGLVAHKTAPRPFTGFYHLPLFTRLLPDLLVMGRRREKVRCLLRLLMPPSAWLRAYYQLADDESPAPHHLLHLLKLMAHYLAEILALMPPLKLAGPVGLMRGRRSRNAHSTIRRLAAPIAPGTRPAHPPCSQR